MSRAIYKYQLKAKPNGLEKLQLPADARVLDVQFVNNEFQLWAYLDPTAPKVEWVIATFFTGDLPVHPQQEGAVDTLTHVATVKTRQSPFDAYFMWHFFAGRML